MLEAGVAVFGGCCGTTAEHIAALHAALKDAKFVPPAPEHTDLLPAATEKLPCYLPTDAGHGPVLTAGPDLEDRLAGCARRQRAHGRAACCRPGRTSTH